MMDKTLKSKLMIGGFFSLIAINIVGLVIPITMALYKKDAESDGFYGKVALRSYFDSGDGTTPETAYVITKPRHLYNLSRLQSFGVFDTKTYFQLGKEIGEGTYMCYTDDGDPVPFLDMSKSTYDFERISAIGSEARPFYGEFNGNGLEIKNLHVYADPEDAGLFGYTAHGSKIHDLFLDNITIHSIGYESAFEDLYGAGQAAAVGTSFVYDYDNGAIHDTFTKTDTTKVQSLDFDAAPIFNWDGTSTEPLITVPAPIITYNKDPDSTYNYKFLISGDFLKYVDGDQSVQVDLPATYKFFKGEKENTEEIPTYPINASSSVSLVVSKTDNLGLDHSKVISTLEFDFSLANATTSILTMNCRLGDEHTNNIGLIVGHCDGTINHCYVSEGSFVMNDKNDHIGMINGSNYGLVGLIGGTVHNRAAEESEGDTGLGKDIGVLDFSTVYDDIIRKPANPSDPSPSFTSPYGVEKYGGVTYNPTTSRKYADYLRKKGDDYITLEENSVTFNGRHVISNNDLGVFTIATHYDTTGMDDQVGYYLDYSVVRKDDTVVNDKYYIYYSTGEYQKGWGTFSDFTSSMSADNPVQMQIGHHLPRADQVSSGSFDLRDRYQNYFFRFQIDPASRTNRGFYFADVDKTTAGGSFISKYFENKLVDEDGNPIKAESNSKRSGIMIRNSLGQEISKLYCSFGTPDLTTSGGEVFCVNNADFGYPASNMVNFEIKKPVANVTVVAGLVDNEVPAALGVYKIDELTRYNRGEDNKYMELDYDDPDYAFFMPTDDHLAYFDYKVTDDGKGKIGTYNNLDTFVPGDEHTDATLTYEYNGHQYDSANGKTRMFCHTFKLPEGRYCLGSATPGLAKIFYVCAQGQTDGTLEFDDNAYASKDEVKNVDFVKGPRFTINDEENPTDYTSNYNYSMDNPHIEDQRCYVALVNSDRSSFKASELDIKFKYNNGVFYVTTTGDTDNVIHISLTTYAAAIDEQYSDTPISLFGAAQTTTDPVIYPVNP